MSIPTASSVFLKTLVGTGITHAFVNWGSDHPALLADLDRQRSSNGHGQQTQPVIVTCPNEMVALTAAQGYAQVTGRPALVIVHVDVGTQALAGAIHNVDRNRAPVIIYAGASPFSSEGEHKGSRNEWIMWLQDIPDQTAIVRQYMRHTSQLYSALTIPGAVRRAVQIATSEPKGPVYLWARREVMEQELDPLLFKQLTASTSADQKTWPAVEPAALSSTATSRIAAALLTAQAPLIITSHLGRNPHAVSSLLALSTLLAVPILPVCPSVVSVPHSHPFGLAPTFLAGPLPHPTSTGLGEEEESGPSNGLAHLSGADVVLVIDADLAWIPGNDQRPSPGARVFVLDGGDPLKTTVKMGSWNGEAEMVCRADAEVALGQILDAVRAVDGAGVIAEGEEVRRRARRLSVGWERRVREMDRLQENFSPVGDSWYVTYTVPNILGALRDAIYRATPSRGTRTLVLNESITNYQIVWEHMRPEVPGNMLSGGGASLGWSLAAAVGASMGGSVASADDGGEGGSKFDLIVAIVGDGSFMFGIPSSVYWMARRYDTPFLTIILNNGGWKAPKLSMLAVHPIGVNDRPLAAVPGDVLTTGFGPVCPDYSQIAVAASAGWAWGRKVGGKLPEGASSEALVGDGGMAALESTIAEGVRVVLEEKRCAVVDCVLEGI